ncbi:hypothetical protein [Hymenobacter weizhouensis]|uniref:hypothetical protein n=1 Tax=Hymenobacter sp. YIM 151500-1 TaxID=2987689 RepID=UPI00222736A6|nr:hypothetical protein [Hymenobacter sp. YIM 151500-1]UYZ65310.1 hypothetical protein OIS53_20185 [Hymenobacter sp. YIM 151500-1]
MGEIIKPGDIKAWVKQLESCASLDDYLLGENGNLNLLNISIATGWGLENGREAEALTHYKRLLQRLSVYLAKFEKLKANRAFRGKVKNLSGTSLLATLSELALAYYLAGEGYEVKFETKFKRTDITTEKDVDLTVTDGRGQIAHLEVFMPHKTMDVDGFFDLDEDDADFAGRVSAKLLDKFGSEGFSGLNGQVFLAVNKAFFDRIRLKDALSYTASDYRALARLTPRHVDGILLFEDDFGSDNSFRLGPLLRRP